MSGVAGRLQFFADQPPGDGVDFVQHVGHAALGAGQHLHHQGAGEDAILAQNVAPDAETAAALAGQEHVVILHGGGQVFEADRGLVAGFAKVGGQTIQQVGGGQIAGNAAPVAPHLVEIEVEKEQQFVGGNEGAVGVHNGDAVGVAVHGQAEIVAPFAHGGDEAGQGLEIRGGGASAEEGIVALVDGGHPAAGFGEDGLQGDAPHAVHGVEDHVQPGLADGLHVDQGFHGIDVGVGIVDHLDPAALLGRVQFDFDHLCGVEPVGFIFDLAGLLVQGQGAIAGEDFQPVPLGRVVAGREDQPIGKVLLGRHVGDQRGGHVLGQEFHADVVAGEDFRGGLGGHIAQKTAVVADQHAVRLPALAGDVVGQGLAQTPHIAQGEPLTDQRPPAARAKADDAVFFDEAGAQLAFLEDDGCLDQVLGGVDALGLILIQHLIAGHGASILQKVADAGGEGDHVGLALGQYLGQGRPQAGGLDHIRADI